MHSYCRDNTIKLEEQDPLFRYSDNFHLCLTNFYDNDSSEEKIIHSKCSAQEIVKIIEETVDICDTPMQEILELVSTDPNFKGADMDLVRTKILKQKKLLKRIRAKNRVYRPQPKPFVVEPTILDDQEHKKKRNRISAQVSRDRRKQCVRQLKQLNHKLEEQIKTTKLENDQLRKELERVHLQRQAEEDKNLPSSADPLKGQLVKLIMFFGLVLLLSTIKEAFGEEGVSVPSFHEFKLPVLEFPRELGIKRHFDQSFRQKETDIMEMMGEPLAELLGEELHARVKDRIEIKIDMWRAFRYEQSIDWGSSKLKSIQNLVFT